MRRAKALKYVIFSAVMAGVMSASYYAFTNAGGSPAGYSGAPSENNCSSCHTGSTYTAPSSVVRMTVNGASPQYYKPDTTYVIAISASKNGINKWGFEVTGLKDSDNTCIGTYASTSVPVAIVTATIAGKTRSYAVQTSSGTAGTNGRSWSFNWTAPHTNVGSITFYITAVAANGNNLVTGDQVFGNSYTMTAYPKIPTTGFKYQPLLPCEGDSVAFTDTSSNNPTSWKWTFTGGTPSSSTEKNPKVVFKVWGGHKVTLVATNSVGSSIALTKIVNVNPNPKDSVYRLRPLEFCYGDSTTLKATSGDSYLWSSGDTVQTINTRKSGTYYVKVTLNGCTTKSQPVVVKAHIKTPNNLVRMQGGDTLCAGDTAKFSFSSSTAKAWKYYNGKTVIATGGNSLVLGSLTGTSNLIYTLATDSLGCKSDTSAKYKEAIRQPLPAAVLTAGTSTTQSVSFTWKQVTGATGYEVSEDTGKTWINVGRTLSYSKTGLSPAYSIKFLVRPADRAPCNLGKQASIVVSSLPCSPKKYHVFADTLVCPKTTGLVTFSDISAKRYEIILNGNSSRDTVYPFYITQDTTVHFSIFDSAETNCGTAEVDPKLKIIQYPVLKESTDKPFYCGTADAATVSGTPGFEEYDVFVNGKLAQSDITRSYITDSFNDGDRVVMIAKYRGCQSDSSNAIILHRYNAPEAYFNYKSTGKGVFEFINKSKNEGSRTWSFGDGSTDTSENPVHSFTTNKIYTVWLVVDGDGGCKDSISKTITATGIKPSNIDPQSLSILPNPFNTDFNLEFESRFAGKVKVDIIDATGKTVRKYDDLGMNIGHNSIALSPGDLPAGVYYLVINDGKGYTVRNMVKQ